MKVPFIVNFRELNPDNQNANAMLKKIKQQD